MDGPNTGEIGSGEGLHGQGGVCPHIVGEQGPIGGVGAVDGDGDGRREHAGSVPEAAGDEEDFAGIEQKAHGNGFGEEREFCKIGVFDIGNLRGIVLIGLYIEEVGLVLGEGSVFLDAVDLGEEGMGMVAVKMQEGKFGAFAADVQFRRAVVQTRAKDAREAAIEPVGEEIAGQRRDIGEEFGQEAVDDFAAQVRRGMVRAGRLDAVDEVGHGVALAVDGQIQRAIPGLEIIGTPSAEGAPVSDRAADDYRFFGEEIFADEFFVG